VETSFQCSCCGISMASASVMTGVLRDRTVQEAGGLVREFKYMVRHPEDVDEALLDTDRRAILSVVRASPSRGNCALLAWHTLDAALQGVESTLLGVAEDQ
jgi:nitrogen fixation protein NifU and related proteins